MGIYIEALALYIVLFLSGFVASTGNMPPKTEVFSILAEVYKIVLYIIPSLALIWYLIIRGKLAYPIPTQVSGKSSSVNLGLKPEKKDVISTFIALPCLIFVGFAITFLASRTEEPASQIYLHSPNSVWGWIVLCLSIFLSAYLEESFFRYYFLTRKNEFNLSSVNIIVFSTTLFSICHIYEGHWGFLNSVISAVILAIIFLRYQSLHGIAIAHGLYNIAAYAINTIINKG